MLDTTVMTRTELGRIQKITFGWGGYQDAMLGLSITLGGKSWGVGDFKGAWGIDRSERAQWTEEDRLRQLGEACMYLRDLLKKANKQTLDQLQGAPIEATFDGNKLVSWRVLDEVL
jgi:hypothetical protein